jgi:hypothetical protein
VESGCTSQRRGQLIVVADVDDLHVVAFGEELLD